MLFKQQITKMKIRLCSLIFVRCCSHANKVRGSGLESHIMCYEGVGGGGRETCFIRHVIMTQRSRFRMTQLYSEDNEQLLY